MFSHNLYSCVKGLLLVYLYRTATALPRQNLLSHERKPRHKIYSMQQTLCLCFFSSELSFSFLKVIIFTFDQNKVLLVCQVRDPTLRSSLLDLSSFEDPLLLLSLLSLCFLSTSVPSAIFSVPPIAPHNVKLLLLPSKMSLMVNLMMVFSILLTSTNDVKIPVLWKISTSLKRNIFLLLT
jgi:hypothetical protein